MHQRSKHNLRTVIVLYLYSLFAGLCACGATALQIQARTADSVARAVNRALPTLIDEEENQGNVAINDSTSAQQAQERLDRIVADWKAFWAAWAVLREAQGEWADLITAAMAGREYSVTDALRLGDRIRSAWCAVRAAIPPPSTLPDLPLVPCPALDAGTTTDAGATDHE